MRKRIFDLDGVFYSYSPAFNAHAIEAMAQAGINLGVKLSYEEACEVVKDSYLTHKFGGHRFVHEHGLKVGDIAFAYHDVANVAIITPDTELLTAFRAAAAVHCPSTQIILTQSTGNWPKKLLPHLHDIGPLFGAVLCNEDANYALKSNSRAPFELALETLQSEAGDTDMIEDSLSNLVIPKDMGMRTIYIHHGKPLDELPSYVDAQVAWPGQVYKLDIAG